MTAPAIVTVPVQPSREDGREEFGRSSHQFAMKPLAVRTLAAERSKEHPPELAADTDVDRAATLGNDAVDAKFVPESLKKFGDQRVPFVVREGPADEILIRAAFREE
jgi:hypothetical protein